MEPIAPPANCVMCGYELRGIDTAVCPECAWPIGERAGFAGYQVSQRIVLRRALRWLAPIQIGLLAPAAGFVIGMLGTLVGMLGLDMVGNVVIWIAVVWVIVPLLATVLLYPLPFVWLILASTSADGLVHDQSLRQWSIAALVSAVITVGIVVVGCTVPVSGLGGAPIWLRLPMSVGAVGLPAVHILIVAGLARECVRRIGEVMPPVRTTMLWSLAAAALLNLVGSDPAGGQPTLLQPLGVLVLLLLLASILDRFAPVRKALAPK